ncbi:secreted seminal-vesicle Ly-6 protein 1-like [Crotalus tigris]|uniref:secreted seminal-vesicle Ly-6 protein 1-like n=1 Tax=Crotalus tigris TaxID=88082 RepID=UPI00192F86C9|nr:secreted seminal-vesicle Ly-6 protein 1-like [Crotalus tigris]
MSKALWFSIAILLCSALEAEALTCKRCSKFPKGSACKEPSKTCIAKPDQKCIIVYFSGTFEDFMVQTCTKSNHQCHLNWELTLLGVRDIKCCDDHDLCNTP